MVGMCNFVKFDKSSQFESIEGTIKFTQNMPSSMQNTTDVDVMLSGLEPFTNYLLGIRNTT